MQKSLFRVVENSKFLNRLRNGHLEKSVATGICRVQRSPKTAKTPLKVHLRLRFQNLGKPRTAGLCGRAAGACDCGSLSCTKIERPSPLEKPSCKVRLFAQNRSRKYCPKVTAASSISNHFSSHFSTSLTNALRLLSRVKVGTHSPFGEESHTTAHTAKQGPSGRGRYHYPRHVLHVYEHPRAGCQNGVLCRFGILAGCAPEERREPAGQRCAYARHCSEASRPRRAA